MEEKLEEKLSPREKFRKTAELRTQAVIEKLRILGNCSNKRDYEYSAEDGTKMFGAIERQLRETKNRFQSKSKNRNFTFE